MESGSGASHEAFPRDGAPAHGPGSGDGWIRTSDGRSYWGLYGAAGLLLRHVDEQGTSRFLLAQRSTRVHRGHGDWAIPGGAIDRGEHSFDAAVREFSEEIGPVPSGLVVVGTHVVEPLAGVWSYSTWCADVMEMPSYDATLNHENDAAAWFTHREMVSVPLFGPLHSALGELLAIFDGR